MNNAHTAQLIKNTAKSNGKSISAALLECDIRKSLIYDMEKRNYTPSAKIIERIADYFEVSVDYLLGRTDKPEINK